MVVLIPYNNGVSASNSQRCINLPSGIADNTSVRGIKLKIAYRFPEVLLARMVTLSFAEAVKE
ncbi:MAG: hypothetical protein AB1480_17355 [Nitrospirota bacterium]